MIVRFDQFGNYEQPHLILCEPNSAHRTRAIIAEELPEACAENLGTVYQYAGETTAEYTNSHFYVCVSEEDDGEFVYSYEDTQITLYPVISNVIGEIPYCSDVECVFNFNDLSAVNFRMYLPPAYHDDFSIVSKIYSKVLKHRYIFVEDFGYFRIEDVKTTSTESERYKDISASSCEIELKNRAMPYVADATYSIGELLTMIHNEVPQWSILIDDADKEYFAETIGKRAFADVDVKKKIYDFMMDDMQKAFDCIFVFDIIDRAVHVYAKYLYDHKTDIHLTRTDVVNTIKTEEENIGAYSAMTGYGEKDEVDFSAINPLGTNVVYNLSYYLSWMPTELSTKVQTWMLLISLIEDSYYAKSVEYFEALTELHTAQSEYDRITKQLELYQKCLTNVTDTANASSADFYNDQLNGIGVTDQSKWVSITQDVEDTKTQLNALIAATEQEQADALAEQQRLTTVVDTKESERTALSDQVRIDSYFTYSEYRNLVNYIYEGNYKDDNIIVTDIMDVEEEMAVRRKLYKETKQKLARVANPVIKFDIDTDSFIFTQTFARWTGQLETGRTICVEVDDGVMINVFVKSIEVNFEDSNARLSFGNTLKRNDARSLFEDVFENITAVGSTFSHV